MVKEPLEREELREEDTWDLKSLFENEELWEEELKSVRKLAAEIRKGSDKFISSAENLLKTLKKRPAN